MTEKTYSQMRREFYEAYRTKIVPAVQKEDTIRKQKLAFAIILSSLLFVGASFLLYLAFVNGGIFSDDNEGVVKLSIIAYTSSYFSWRWIKKGFESKIKRRIMPFVTSCYDNLKWYQYGIGRHDCCDDIRIIQSSLVEKYNFEDYDDVFCGSYHDVKFDILEAKYEIKSSRSSITVFDGVIIKFDMNKNFTGNTVVKTKHFNIGDGVQNKNLKQTKLEDIEFNKKYNVFTDDEVEARYLLTPTFMEKLKKVQVAFSADRVDCAFYDKYLLIALHTKKDLFSLCSLIKPVDDAKQYFTMYEEIVSIIKLIDHFKLNQKIGL